jgi:hypothetical protein
MKLNQRRPRTLHPEQSGTSGRQHRRGRAPHPNPHRNALISLARQRNCLWAPAVGILPRRGKRRPPPPLEHVAFELLRSSSQSPANACIHLGEAMTRSRRGASDPLVWMTSSLRSLVMTILSDSRTPYPASSPLIGFTPIVSGNTFVPSTVAERPNWSASRPLSAARRSVVGFRSRFS